MGNECSSIQISPTENVGDVEETGVLSDELEATKVIMQNQICVKILGALHAQVFKTKTKTENKCEGMLTSLCTLSTASSKEFWS